jgi:hypothetical protein
MSEDMRQDKTAYDSKEVVNGVAAHLAALQEGKPSTPEPETEDLEAGEEPKPKNDSDEDKPPTQDKDQGPEAGDDKKPSIPTNIYRSLEHNGWKPEKIASFYKVDPELAMQVFEQIHESTNNLSRQFSEIGRTRINTERQKNQPVVKKEEEQSQSVIDIEALRKADPSNPLLPVVEGMNKVLTQLTARPTMEPQQRQTRTQEDIALASQVMSFLGADQMKVFDDFYGPAYDEARMPTFDGHGLSPGQMANRDALLEQADAIWVGAREHGRNLTVPEALGLAHSLLTEGMRTQQLRQELVSKVKQRAKGMTLRPGKSKPVLAREGDKPKTQQELEQRTEARLAKLRTRH